MFGKANHAARDTWAHGVGGQREGRQRESPPSGTSGTIDDAREELTEQLRSLKVRDQAPEVRGDARLGRHVESQHEVIASRARVDAVGTNAPCR